MCLQLTNSTILKFKKGVRANYAPENAKKFKQTKKYLNLNISYNKKNKLRID